MMRYINRTNIRLAAAIGLVLLKPLHSKAQQDKVLKDATIEQIVQYALIHQPLVQQASIDEAITNENVKSRIADWYPQLNFANTFQHFFELQTNTVGQNQVKFGAHNTITSQLIFTQTLFNRDVLLASQTAKNVRSQASQSTSKAKLEIATNAMKAYYDLMAIRQQIELNKESIVRLKQSLEDAHSRYKSGIVDKGDYKRAIILLGNADATLRTNQETLNYKTTYLKTLIGYPLNADLSVIVGTGILESNIEIDTLQPLAVERHIDYKILTTQYGLQDEYLKYSKNAVLPSINLFGAYSLNYQDNDFNNLFQEKFPYSYAGISISVPIYTGGKRAAKIREQKLVKERLELSLSNLQDFLGADYKRAIANYKSSFFNFNIQKDNVQVAEELYNLVNDQYANGIKSYLELTIAESELNTTRINYYNSWYQMLSSKIDVLKTSGQLNY